jgi:hypothetical protein
VALIMFGKRKKPLSPASSEPTATITQVYVIFGGAQPGRDELEQLLATVERDTGFDLAATPLSITSSKIAEPSRKMAAVVVNAYEENGDLPPGSVDRMITRSYTVSGAPRLVVLIPSAPAGSPNRWARKLLPEHLARIGPASPELARRRGWAALGSEPVLAFLADAQDQTMRQFDDVQVAVSLLPATDPDRIRGLMGGGYLTWADTVPGLVAKMAGESGQTDFAHVILCHEKGRRAVHLGYYPSDRKNPSLPWDLLAPEDQRNIRRKA